VNSPPLDGGAIVPHETVVELSGPLPPAVEFERYERALPGAAERLLVMAEKQAQSRIQFDDKALSASIKIEIIGQILAFIAIILSIGAAVVCVVLGQPLASIAPAFVAFTGIASVFINNRRR